MSVELLLAVVGVALTVVFGFFGLRAIKRKKLSQQQKVGKGSVAIQSGRDTNIGDRK